MPWEGLEDRREPTEAQLRYYRSLFEELNGEAADETIITTMSRTQMSQAIDEFVRERDRRRAEGTRRTASSTVSAQDTVRTARRALEEESVFTRVTGRPSPERLGSRTRTEMPQRRGTQRRNYEPAGTNQEAPIWGHHKNAPIAPVVPERTEPAPAAYVEIDALRAVSEEDISAVQLEMREAIDTRIWEELSRINVTPPVTAAQTTTQYTFTTEDMARAADLTRNTHFVPEYPRPFGVIPVEPFDMSIPPPTRLVDNRITVENPEMYGEFSANVVRKFAAAINAIAPCQIGINFEQTQGFAPEEIIFKVRIRHAGTIYRDLFVREYISVSTFNTSRRDELENMIATHIAGHIRTAYERGEHNREITTNNPESI